MFSGKREKALLEEELAALRETEKRERELLHKIAGQKDTAEEQFARMTASRAQMEKEIEEIEQQMQQNGELSENGAQAAGELHNTLITMNNGIATFDANHSVFMEQVKGQNEKVVEIVENNKHFTTPMKHISEAPQALREMRQALGERAERMEELSKTMGVLALNSAIEAGRMGESGTRFVTAAEQVRAYADDYEQEALALKDQLGEAEERIASLEEQVHHLNELLKENNISMGKLYRDCAQNMAAYETGQIGLRGLIQDTAVARADVLQQSADENVRAREAFLKYVSGMQEELAEQLFVTRQTVSNYENGRTRPDVDQILRLAEIFDTDANAVLYGPPVPEGRKTALIQAAAGCGLTAAIYLLYRFFLPTAQDIQSFHYDPRWTAALMYVVRPVFLLLLGWSLVQVLSLAAAVKLPEKPWVRCLRRGLLAIVLCGILSSLFVCIAFFVDVGNVYSVLRPFLYRIIKWNQKPIFHPLLGALLCLLGFPPKRKAPVEKQISQ